MLDVSLKKLNKYIFYFKMNILIIQPYEICSYNFIKKLLDDRKKIHILLKTSNKYSLDQVFHKFLKKYGLFKYNSDQCILIEGDCMNQNIFLDDKNRSKIYDEIYYFEGNSNFLIDNNYLITHNYNIANIVNFIGSRSIKFVYSKCLNETNRNEIHYFRKNIDTIKNLENYNIYYTNSLIYTDNGFIENNTKFFFFITKSISLSKFPSNLLNENIQFLDLEMFIKLVYTKTDNYHKNKVILVDGLKLTYKNILDNIKKYKIFTVNKDEWLVNFAKKYNLILKDSLFSNTKYQSIDFDTKLQPKLNFEFKNILLYLQFNRLIPFYPTFNKLFSSIVILFTSGLFLFFFTIFILITYLTNKKLFYGLIIFSVIQFPQFDKFIYQGRRFIMHLFSFMTKEFIIDDSITAYNFFEKSSVFCNYPHDVLPLTTITNHLLDPDFYKLSNGDNTYGLMNRGVFYIPFIKPLAYLIGGNDCSEVNIISKIKEKKNIHIFLGGMDEGLLNLYNFKNNSKLCIKNRKGIFKIALKEGIQLIPTYTFYNKRFTLEENSYLLNIRTIFNQILNIIPNNNTLFVVGKPLKVEQVKNPTDEDIINLRNQFIEELENLFNKYKTTFGWNDKFLEIY